jgi:hypothetical protein
MAPYGSPGDILQISPLPNIAIIDTSRSLILILLFEFNVVWRLLKVTTFIAKVSCWPVIIHRSAA